MNPRWEIREYEADKPTNYVLTLIEDENIEKSNNNDDGILLSMYIKKMEKNCFCLGECLYEVYPGTKLWVISGKANNHIIYSFNTQTQQLFYLKAFNGAINDIQISEAESRFREMYK